MKPRGCTATHYDPGEGKEVTRAVQWTDGGRYGVVVGYEDGPKRVFWFSPEAVYLRWNSWLRGGGQASIELPDKERGDDLGISGGKTRK